MPPCPAQAIATAATRAKLAGTLPVYGHSAGIHLMRPLPTATTTTRIRTEFGFIAVSRTNAHFFFSTKPSLPPLRPRLVSTVSAIPSSSHPAQPSSLSSLSSLSSYLSSSSSLSASHALPSTVARPSTAFRYSTTNRTYLRHHLKNTFPILNRLVELHPHPSRNSHSELFHLRASFSATAIQPTTNMEKHAQAQVQLDSLKNPDKYWGNFASLLHWDQPYSKVLTHNAMAPPTDAYHWFKDGKLNTCFNAIDRHVLSGRGKQVAIYYDSPLNNEKRQLTYQELLDQVQTCAGVIASHGLKKGDTVLIYSMYKTCFLVAQ
jgi:hypothetical protein